MRSAADTRRRIVDAAYQLFYRAGFARVGVDAIAEAANVTKRTLYYHFDSKDALLAAVLDAQHDLALARIATWSASDAADATARVAALFAEHAAWCRRPAWRGSGFTRAAIEYADSPGHPARRAARRHKKAVEQALAAALERDGLADAVDAAREIVLLVEGANALVLIHADPRYADAAGAAAAALIVRYRGATAKRRKTLVSRRSAARRPEPARNVSSMRSITRAVRAADSPVLGQRPMPFISSTIVWISG
jgi:AcrR family transcriptional regulator